MPAETPNARQMRATVSTVGTRRLFSTIAIICRDNRVRCAISFMDSFRALRCFWMTYAKASHTGSSDVRGMDPTFIKDL
jgi:hypothetical protein